jgi:hypothetical protein
MHASAVPCSSFDSGYIDVLTTRCDRFKARSFFLVQIRSRNPRFAPLGRLSDVRDAVVIGRLVWMRS